MSATLQSCPLKTFEGEHFTNSARVEEGFLDHMKTIDKYAGECGVKVLVTHSFRKEGVPLTDVIVPPSKTSNHLVGHAIDMNLYYKGKLCNSKCLINEEAWPEGVGCFISKIRNNKNLRWGGDFEPKDPVHIDDDLYDRDRSLYKKLYDTLQENC